MSNSEKYQYDVDQIQNQQPDANLIRVRDRFLQYTYFYSLFCIFFLLVMFILFMALGQSQTGRPTRTNCFNSMWWSLFGFLSAIYLWQDIHLRCDRAFGSQVMIEKCTLLVRSFIAFLLFLSSFVSLFAYLTTLIELAALWCFFCTTINLLIFVIGITRRGETSTFIQDESRLQWNQNTFQLCCSYLFFVSGLLSILFLHGLATYQSIQLAQNTDIVPAPGKFYDGLHLYCDGNAETSQGTIVLIAGNKQPSYVWSQLMKQVAINNARICSYDRGGYGWSETTQLPRDTDTLASEFYSTLISSNQQAPFIIVSHGDSSHIAFSLTNKYYNQVGGLILLDAETPASEQKACAAKGKPVYTNLQRVLDVFGFTRFFYDSEISFGISQMNQDFQDKYKRLISTTRYSNSQYYEIISENSCSQRIANYQAGFGSLPITVFTSGNRLNSTCSNFHIKENSDECREFIDKQKPIMPLNALQAYRQTFLSNNTKWYICSNCASQIYLDAPDEVVNIIYQHIQQLTQLSQTNSELNNAYYDRITINDTLAPVLEKDREVSIQCRSNRTPFQFDCSTSICDWCQDKAQCLSSGLNRCQSINLKLLPQNDCTNSCLNFQDCTKIECSHNFIPIKSSPCYMNFGCL